MASDANEPANWRAADGRRSADGREWTFAIPIADDLRAVAAVCFRLAPRAPLGACTVQTIVECDHHGSFSHERRLDRLPAGGLRERAPLTNAPVFWRAVGHQGTWSAWERLTIRRLEIKVFSEAPTRTALGVEYGWVAAPAEEGAAQLAWSKPLADPVELGTRFELAFDLKPRAVNPYDVESLEICGRITTPSGAQRELTPFLYQNFEAVNGAAGERIVPKGPKHFRLRYRPGETGLHTYELVWRKGNGGQTLARGTFRVMPGAPPDFMRISRRNPRYFEHADGRFYYPIGWNIAYPVDHPYGSSYVPYLPQEQSLTHIRKLLDDLADSGGNCVRAWICTWWNEIEWNGAFDNYSGIGRYNLKNAWLTDRLLDDCERRGIRMLLTTTDHSRLNLGWNENPYSNGNGGFLWWAHGFWSHPSAIAATSKRLRYILARYADSPAILSWDFMSEADLVSGYGWHEARSRLLAYMDLIRRLDPYRRPVSTHICMVNQDYSFYDADGVEYINSNAYPGNASLPEEQAAAVRRFADLFGGKDKPVIVSECGGHWGGDPACKMRRDIVAAIWAGAVSRLSALPMSWWWNFTYGEDLGRRYRVVADFLADLDLIAEDRPEKGGWNHRRTSVESVEGNLRALMAGNRRSRLLLLYNQDTFCRTRLIPTVCSNNVVTFGDMEPGDYTAEYWSTRTGYSGNHAAFQVRDDGVGRLTPPPFDEAWAVKIRPAGAATSPAAMRPSPPLAAVPSAPAPLRPPAGQTAAERFSWRIESLAPPAAAPAADRCVWEVRIALPDACAGFYPDLRDAGGKVVACAWEFLDGARGWLLRIPAAARGPFVAKPRTTPPAENRTFDENKVGLEVESGFWNRPESLSREEDFRNRLAQVDARRTARVPTIDQLENPLGANHWSLSCYRGPLLIPTNGLYRFALNVDDGGLLRVDGTTLVTWPAPHDMEVVNRPDENLWLQAGSLRLTAGIHWIECYHQQWAGSQIIRAGWSVEAELSGPDSLVARPLDAAARGWQTIPAWALDGRIPARVTICLDRKPIAEIRPSLGLHLRRPDRPFPSVALRRPGEPANGFVFFSAPGWQCATLDGRRVPVWAHNDHWRDFSLDWEQAQDPLRGPMLKTLAFDATVPLQLRVGRRDLGERVHRPRDWSVWPLVPADRGQPFVLTLAGHVCISNTVEAWPVVAAASVAPSRGPAATRIVQLDALLPPLPLSGAALRAAGVPGPVSEWIEPEGIPHDVWRQDADALRRTLRKRGPLPGRALIALDRRAAILGLTGEDVYRQLGTHLQALSDLGVMPILALSAELDLLDPLSRQQAFSLLRLQREFRCPLVDMRATAP